MTLRNEILDAAGTLLRTRGAAGATTKEIAAAAGCAEGSLYRHFPDKGALLFAAVEKHLPTLDAVLAVGDGDLRHHFERVAVALVDYFGKLLPLGVALAADVELADRNRERMRSGRIGPHKLLEHLAEHFAVGQLEGRIRAAADPLTLAALLAGPCFHFAFMRFFAGGVPLWESPAQFASAVAEPLLAVASPDPPPKRAKRTRRKDA
ncbi:MAG: TetR family transcriptional regulator [Gemmataceae bacterium]|nr:TetR family transcriptional regulator [Gemmataceae bacterium]